MDQLWKWPFSYGLPHRRLLLLVVVMVIASCLKSQDHSCVSQDGPAVAVVRATALRRRLQIKLAIPPDHIVLTPGQPVPTLTQAPGRVATGVPIFKGLV